MQICCNMPANLPADRAVRIYFEVVAGWLFRASVFWVTYQNDKVSLASKCTKVGTESPGQVCQ